MGLLFLSLAKSKLASYSFCLFPPCSLLIADFWTRGIEGKLDAGSERILRVLARWLTGCAPFLMLLAWIPGFKLQVFQGSPVAILIMSLATVVCFWGWRAMWRGDVRAMFSHGVISVAGMCVCGVVVFLPSVAELYSGRAIAGYLNQQVQQPVDVVFIEERLGSALFYLNPRLRYEVLKGRITSKTSNAFVISYREQRDQWVVMPERQVSFIDRHVEFGDLKYEKFQRYRIYKGGGFKPLEWARESRLEKNSTWENGNWHL